MVHLTRDVDPTSLFGADLKDIFGPKADRVHVSELSRKELKKRLEQIDKFLPTDHLGDFPTMYQVTNYALETLKTSRALWGIDLDWCKTLIGCGILRHRSQYKPIKLVSKNNQTQRGLNLRHVVEDILFKFDPKSVLTGLARFSKKTKRYYINDGQHRLVACIIMGIRDIPLDVEISELQSTDLRHYAVINLNSLLPSEYDKYRTMVKAVEYAKAENVEIHDPDYVRAWKVKNILDKYRCRMVEQGTTRAPLLCTGVGNMLKHHKDYGSTIFERAVSINAIAHTKAPLASQNIWGICEFLDTQGSELDIIGGKIGVQDIDMFVADALLHYTPYRNKNGFYKDANSALIASLKKRSGSELAIPYSQRVAAAIEKLARVVHPEVTWNGVIFNNVNIADTWLNEFKFIKQ